MQDADPVSSGGGSKETKSPDGEDMLSEAPFHYHDSDAWLDVDSGNEPWDLEEFLEWEMDGDLEPYGSEDVPDETSSQGKKEPDGYFDYHPPQPQRRWEEDRGPRMCRGPSLRRSRSSEDTLSLYTPPDTCFFDARDIYDGLESPGAEPTYLAEDVWEGSDVEEIESTRLVGMPRIVCPKPVSASEALDFRAILRALESVEVSSGRQN